MSAIKYWFLGFRAGWQSQAVVPAWAFTAHDQIVLSYYRGYSTAQNIKEAFRR